MYVFRPPSRLPPTGPSWLSSKGGAAITIAALAGSYSILGTNVTFGRTLSADAGSYSIAGTDAGLTAQRVLSGGAGIGTYTIAGTDIAVGLSRAVDPGAYTIAGTDVAFARSMAAAVGAYAIAGTDATLTKTRILAAVAGAYSIAGTDIAIGLSRSVDTGVYVIAGTDASLIEGRILAADSGAYTIVGTSIDIGLSRAVASGAYTIAGTAVSFGRTLVVASGAYAIAGTNISIGLSRSVASGVYTIVGTNATLIVNAGGDVTIVANSGAYTIAGTSIDIGLSRSVAVGAYTITGTDAGLTVQRVLSGGAAIGVYAIAGTDATLLTGRRTVAAAGAYTITGTAVAFQRDRLLAATAGVYVISGTDVDFVIVRDDGFTCPADPVAGACTQVTDPVFVSDVVNRYFTDFGANTTGVFPSDWDATETGGGLYTVEDDVLFTGGKKLEKTVGSTRSTALWDTPQYSTGDIDMLIRFKVGNSASGAGDVIIFVIRSADDPTVRSIYCQINLDLGPAGTMVVGENLSVTTSVALTGKSLTNSAFIFLRIKHDTVTGIVSFTTWLASASEPAVDISFLSTLSTGRAGIVSSWPEQPEVDFVGVGLAGTVAPTETPAAECPADPDVVTCTEVFA